MVSSFTLLSYAILCMQKMSLHYYLTTLVVVACWINGSHGCEWGRIPSNKSISPIIMKQPKDRCDCSSDSKFKSQIYHNYDIMFEDLAKVGCICDEADINEFITLLSEMRVKTLDIVDSYFQCDKKSDPTDAIENAITRYDSHRKSFRSYSRKAFNRLSSKCNSVIQYVRQLPYISAENTIMSIVTCAEIKARENGLQW